MHVMEPKRVGMDRIVNAAAAAGMGYPPPLVVVDLGTATTFSVLDPEGAFIGGAICPGVNTSLKALSKAAAQLPDIFLQDPAGAFEKDPDPSSQIKLPVVAGNTEGCMRSGSLYGNACLIEGMVARMEAELGYPLRVILTGGHASLIHPHLKCAAVRVEELLMQGLYFIYKQIADQTDRGVETP
ncbi:MAG TPA: hypothetical protein DD727_06810 [Clostridiales bacterium]|nr:hypothetical protein [Clostridiales bacterium]